jgi:hypothetical protein
MHPLPTQLLWTNRGTWAVPDRQLPALANVLLHALPTEPFDPNFRGQDLATTYFDDRAADLRSARLDGAHYLTLRIRAYQPAGLYALSAKTESTKFRTELRPDHAEALLQGLMPEHLVGHLPPELQARLLALTGGAPLEPWVAVCCRRYAVEDDQGRMTLDVGVATDTGRCLPFGVLEFKSLDADDPVPGALAALALRPLKLSKFLWSTGGRP